MVALPGTNAWTVPSWSTLAIASLLEDQTISSSAFEFQGLIRAVSV